MSSSVRGRMVSPHGTAGALPDVGRRSTLVTRQRVGRIRQRRRALAAVRRWAVVLAGVAAVTGVIAGGAYWALTSPRLAVASVDVQGASRVPVESIVAMAGIAPGTNLLRIDPAAVVARLESMPQIRRADIIRAFPNHVTIMVEERRPFTLVHAGRLHWLDEEAHVLGEEREAVTPPVPVISGLPEEELVSARGTSGPKARAAMALVRALLRSGSALTAEISEIDMSRRDGPVLYTVDGVEVRLGNEQWEERLARLEGVLAQLASRPGGGVTAVDLRFRDQVVLQNGGGR